MLLVLLADGVFTFLLAWEAMSLVGYLLVVHEHDRDETRRGRLRLPGDDPRSARPSSWSASCFWLLAGGSSSTSPAWPSAAGALGPLARDAIFLALLIGFGTKAGLVPLHVWLPRAHPVAPSHVSALMSGVMLKIALYGLLRVGFDVLGPGPAWWGWLLLAIGLLSAVLGVLYALIERDLKRVLAYSSVENIGIIADRTRRGAGAAAAGRRCGGARADGRRCSTRSTTRSSSRCSSSAPARSTRRPARATSNGSAA